MNGSSIDVWHLIEFIDTYDPSIGQNHSSGFESTVTSLGICCNRSRQTNTWRAPTGSGHSPGRAVKHISQELRLGYRGVANQKNIDITENKLIWNVKRKPILIVVITLWVESHWVTLFRVLPKAYKAKPFWCSRVHRWTAPENAPISRRRLPSVDWISYICWSLLELYQLRPLWTTDSRLLTTE